MSPTDADAMMAALSCGLHAHLGGDECLGRVERRTNGTFASDAQMRSQSLSALLYGGLFVRNVGAPESFASPRTLLGHR